MKNHSYQNLWGSQKHEKRNYVEKIYKAEQKNNPANNLNRSRPREIQACKEWLNTVAENSVSQWKNYILQLPLWLGMAMWPSAGKWDIIWSLKSLPGGTYTLLPFLHTAACNAKVMAGALAAILNHEFKVHTQQAEVSWGHHYFWTYQPEKKINIYLAKTTTFPIILTNTVVESVTSTRGTVPYNSEMEV